MKQFFKKCTYIAVIVAILVVAGTGTVYASTSSLPGDVLYPVKIHVGEGIQGAIKVSDEKKAAWAIEKMTRRINELQNLKESEGMVEKSILLDAQLRIDDYSEEVIASTKELKLKQAEEALVVLVDDLKQVSESFELFKQSLKDIESDETLQNALPTVLQNVEEITKLSSEDIQELKDTKEKIEKILDEVEETDVEENVDGVENNGEEVNDSEDTDKLDTEQPVVTITVFDNVLPANVYASEHANRSIVFGKLRIQTTKDVSFGGAALGCTGDTRVISGIFVSDNAGYTVMPGKRATYGGFESSIVPYNASNPYIIRAGEEKEIRLQFGIKDPSWASDNAPYPVDIRCGYKSVYMSDLETGHMVPITNYKITNPLVAVQAMKTTLHK